MRETKGRCISPDSVVSFGFISFFSYWFCFFFTLGVDWSEGI